MGQQRPGGPAAALPPPPPPPHPLSSSSDLRGGGAGGSALLWEPRDPPLQYSGVSSTTASTTQAHLHHNLRMQQQHHHHHPPAMAGIIGHHQVSKTRLEPRRSASLSQADLVVYDGKMLGRLQQSQSPAIRSPPTATVVSAVSLDPLSSSSSSSQKQQQHVARYHDYYETKYEKPVRLTSAMGSSSITNITGSNSGVGAGRSTAGVDVDTVWKSRWRSTSPPPAPVDDWLPIKPPQLAWAKPAPVVAQQQHVSSSSNSNGSSSRTTSRIPIASGSTAGSTLLMARSMSGDMDHMIYLDRDMQVPPLSMRERTRSIDRGLAQQQQQQPPPAPPSSHGGSKRQQFKTYEEELADYHGRTGSVDRLATANGQQQYNSLQHQQKRGRQRNNLRMGIGLSQVQQQLGLTGSDRRVSLERRHSEVGLNTSSSSGGVGGGGGGRRREASGGDSSNSSSGAGGGGRRSNSNDNNQQFKKIIPTTRPSPPRSVSHGNVNRVYLDGPPDTYAVSRSSQPASSSAIRVTMTETRSLKRPSTNRVATPMTSSPISGAGGGATVGESSTMPRMSKRHHGSSPPQVQQQQQQQQGKSSLPSAQHPGSTTVYLAGGDDPFRKPQQQQQLQQPPRTPQKDSTKSAAAAATGVSSTSIIASAAPLTDASSTGKPCCCLRFNRHGGAGSSQSAFYFHLSPLQQTVL